MVVSSPTVANGVVYVGSYDHLVYALGALQGSQESGEDILQSAVSIALVMVALTIAIVGIVVFYRRKRRA